jgi:PAS domain S-box-containing protein
MLSIAGLDESPQIDVRFLVTQKRSRRPGSAWVPGGIFAGSGSDAGFGSRTMRSRVLALLTRPEAPSLVLGIAVAASFIVVETLVVCSLNVVTGTTGRFGTLFLLGVLVISMVWGFGLSMTMSAASAIAFAYFRNWPTADFAPFEPQNLMVVGVFLVLALVANALAGLARVGERFFDLSPDLLCIIDPEKVVRVNPAFKQILGYSLDELAGRPYLDLVVPEDRDHMRALLEQLPGSAEPVRLENRVSCRDDSRRWVEWSVVWHRGLFYAVGRDVTKRRRDQDELHQAQVVAEASRDKLRELAEQQAALRRVATLVARGASPSEVFAAVADEMAGCLRVNNASVNSFDGDEVVVLALSHLDEGMKNKPVVGERHTLEGDNIATRVLQAGRSTRLDSSDVQRAPGSIAARLREMGLRCTVAVPIVVEGQVWGMAAVGSSAPEPLPPDTEARIGDFADLVATSIANAATRAELHASRARIVAAADDARRRLERDLHDGAQQRLVSLGLQTRLAEASVPPQLDGLKSQLSRVVSGLTDVSTDLQEISRGIHPAILSKGGLVPALKTLARRATVPVVLDLAIDRRLPDSVEVGAYYIVAEALTNAAKHARASQVEVCADSRDDKLYLSIRDDGFGGADFAKGSGLIGLKDRAEALGGRMTIESPAGSGTSLLVTIPLDGD